MNEEQLNRIALMAEKLMIAHLSKKGAPSVIAMEHYFELCYRIAYGFHLKLQEEKDAQINR